MATWSYEVKYVYDNDYNSGAGTFPTPIDITDNVITIENMTDVGTGEINTAVLQLNARDGQFITADGGTTPKINQFDRIYIKLTDKNGATFEKIYEVDSLEQKKTITEGIRLVVNLMGMERHLQQIHFAKQFFYENAFNVAKDVCDLYNSSRGSKQVAVDKQNIVNSGSTYFNELPKWNANNFDYGTAETYAYDGITELVNKLGSSVSAGGAGDFYEFKFIDDLTLGSGTYNANKIQLKAFSSGNSENQSSTPTITNPTDTLPIYSTHGTLEDETGSLVIAKGAKAYGTMPTNSSKFRGHKDAFLLIPDWQSGESYPKYARVNHSDKKWEVTSTNPTTQTPSGSASDWKEIKLGDLVGQDFIYSPYTSTLTKITSSSGSGNDGGDGYKLMTSSGSNPDDTTADHTSGWNPTDTISFDWHGCWDGNLVVKDEKHFRTWVDCKTTSTVPSELKLNGNYYRGLRVLVNGTGSGDFSGFTNVIVQYDGTQWKQHYPYNGAAASTMYQWSANPSQGTQVAVINEGKNYVWKGTSTGWAVDNATYDKSNDCFHPAIKVFSEDGVATSLKSTGSSTSNYSYGKNSATAWQYHFDTWTAWLSGIFTTGKYYAVGAWACFKFPYPTTSDNLPTGYTVGSLYKNPTLDTNNMHLTPSGETGFNASDSEELGILEALSFFIKFKYFFVNSSSDEEIFPFKGKFRFRATCYDTSDNVVTQDFEVAFNEEWEYISLPISGFKIYRARAAKRWGNVVTNLVTPELEVLEVFEWKNLKMISIQCMESYDKVGRFAAEEGQLNNAWDFLTPLVSLSDGFHQRTRLSIDNLHFTKQLTASSGTVTGRNIEPIFMERPYTTNYTQLQQDAKSQLEIEKFRYQAFEIETEGECPANLRFGDSFFLEDEQVVEVPSAEQGTGETTNKIKLVAKKITYTINGTDGGRGGFVRKILGVKRFS